MAELEDKASTPYCYVCGELLPPEDRRIVFLGERDGAHILVTAVHLDGDCPQRVEDGPSHEWLAYQRSAHSPLEPAGSDWT
jgi:hypothetical protein